MLLHYLKIALRNMWKYKSQTLISVIGLAVGFTCFAFSALWIKYEMSYDNFHPKADRIYRVNAAMFKWNSVESNSTNVVNEFTAYPLADWLKSNFPEIEDACGIMPRFLNKNLNPDKISLLYLDYAFCRIFDLPVPENIFIEGNTDRSAVVTDNLKADVKSIKEQQGEFHVQTIIPAWPANTNIRFNMVAPLTDRYTEERLKNWQFESFNTYILIKDGVDVQFLKKKLDKVEIPEWPAPISIIITPIKQLRYNDPAGIIQSDIKFGHIRIFAFAGLLVILSSLFNHLTLYVTRVRMRLRELALRKVNGANDLQIATTLYIDFLSAILLSLIVGFILMSWLLPTFKEFANIGSNNISIYAELLSYAALLILCSVFTGSIPVLYFRKQALNDTIKGSGVHSSRNMFRKVSLLIQLIISLGLMFCSAVFIKQIYYLHHTDLGISRHNIASVQAECCPLSAPHVEKIKQVSGIIDAIPIDKNDFLRNMNSNSGTQIYEENGKKKSITIFFINADTRFFAFFGIEFIKGTTFPNEYDPVKQAVFNGTAVNELGNSISTVLGYKNIKGVTRDFYLTPTVKVKPTVFQYPNPKYNILSAIAYKYEKGMRQKTQQAITQLLRKEFPDQGEFRIDFTYMDDIFDDYFKSDRALLTLLSIVTGACILIAVFGVYSLARLTCEQRRKEIAIRKINGAEVMDIMNIFFKEYLWMLVLAALFAFPAGYVIMNRWLEGYVKQTSMDARLFVLIFLIVFVVIVFSIVSMVWKAANQNPSEVVKKE